MRLLDRSSMLCSLAFVFAIASPVVSYAETNICASESFIAFNWPVPSNAKVRHIMNERGQALEFTFIMSLDRSGEEILVRFDNVVGESINGHKDPNGMAQIAAMTQLPSKIAVDRNGDFIRIVDYPEWALRIASTLAESQGKPHEAGRVRELYMSKQMEELLSARIEGLWSSWSANWQDIPLPIREVRTFPGEEFLSFLEVGLPVEHSIRLSQESETSFTLVFESSGRLAVEGGRLESNINRNVAALGGAVAASTARIEALSTDSTITVELVCGTFQPLRVDASRSFSVFGKFDNGSTRKVVAHTFTTRFEWD